MIREITKIRPNVFAKIKIDNKSSLRAFEKAGLVSKGDGKHVDHKDMNPLNNSKKNLRVVAKRRNVRMQPKTKRR